MLNTKTLFPALLLFSLYGCGSKQPISEAHKSQVDSILLTRSPAKNADHSLIKAQANKDIEALLYVLQKGYGGAKYVPQDKFTAAITNLKNLETTLPEPVTSFDLCKKIAAVLEAIPDRHLELKLGRTHCNVQAKITGNVGPNFGKDTKQAWEQHALHISSALEVPVISIHSFPQMDDSQWLGFQAAIESEMMSAEAMVIDLRGNAGGNDAQGYWLAHELYGATPPSAFSRLIDRQTPEALALIINSFHADELAYLNNAEEVPEDTSSYLKYYRDLLKMSEAGNLPEEKIQKIPFEGKPFDLKRGYNQRVYILVDRETASNAEFTLATLRALPKAKVIGENTNGAIHFGNQGIIVLPESGVEIRMGTHYYEDKDGKFYEVVGFAPDVRTPQGEDAINWVKSDLARKF